MAKWSPFYFTVKLVSERKDTQRWSSEPITYQTVELTRYRWWRPIEVAEVIIKIEPLFSPIFTWKVNDVRVQEPYRTVLVSWYDKRWVLQQKANHEEEKRKSRIASREAFKPVRSPLPEARAISHHGEECSCLSCKAL